MALKFLSELETLESSPTPMALLTLYAGDPPEIQENHSIGLF